MQSLRQASWGLLIALVSIAIVVGGFSISLLEANPTAISTTFTPTSFLITPTFLEIVIIQTPTATSSPTVTATVPANCPPPSGWLPFFVQIGDTLESLALRYKISTQALIQANCLQQGSHLLPGTILYLPPEPTQTSIPCGAPQGWIRYTVQKGDTLYALAQYYHTTVANLQRANCMGSSTDLFTGSIINVPPGPTKTPLKTSTPTQLATSTPTPTADSGNPIPTHTPTNTIAPTLTATTYPIQ